MVVDFCAPETHPPYFAFIPTGTIFLKLSVIWIVWELQEHTACIKCDHTIYVLSYGAHCGNTTMRFKLLITNPNIEHRAGLL